MDLITDPGGGQKKVVMAVVKFKPVIGGYGST